MVVFSFEQNFYLQYILDIKFSEQLKVTYRHENKQILTFEILNAQNCFRRS